MSNFHLSQRSHANLIGVDERLTSMVELAIRTSPIDFGVNEGLRTLEKQRHLVAIGASQTLESKHLTGEAVDLVTYVGGTIRWEWPLYYTLAEHIRSVALSINLSLRWGGAWDVYNFTYTTAPCKKLVDDYAARQKKKGKRAFIDGPHFELCKRSIKG